MRVSCLSYEESVNEYQNFYEYCNVYIVGKNGKSISSQKFYSIILRMCYNVGRTLENEQNTMIFIQEVKKMKIKRLSAIILAGVLTCTVPSATYAADSTEAVVDQAVDILSESGVDELLSDPDTVAELIVSVQDILGQVDVTDEQISSALDTAASGIGVTLSDSEKSTLIKLYNQFKNMDIDQEQLKSHISQVYDKLESLGITKEDVKGILGKLIDVVKNILG